MFKDYVPPPPHPRHTYRVNEIMIPTIRAKQVDTPPPPKRIAQGTFDSSYKRSKQMPKAAEEKFVAPSKQPPSSKYRMQQPKSRRHARKYSPEEKANAFRLRREGWSYLQISKELNVPCGTLTTWFKKLKG